MIIFGYNFKHWKTQQGLINLVSNGYNPSLVILQDKKKLNIPQSKFSIVPKDEYLIEPKKVCEILNLNYVIANHDDYEASGIGIILGARILKKKTINQYDKILNIHPGILPGNRGLDNLKWALALGLPIGVTAHWIDERIDMGKIIKKETIKIYKHDTIKDLYIRQRNLEQKVLIDVLNEGMQEGISFEDDNKFSALPECLDKIINNKYFIKCR